MGPGPRSRGRPLRIPRPPNRVPPPGLEGARKYAKVFGSGREAGPPLPGSMSAVPASEARDHVRAFRLDFEGNTRFPLPLAESRSLIELRIAMAPFPRGVRR